ncbi:MAG: diiron oxygenase [Chitinophagaceae bacterium]|nr:diiron oxygenase [Oligoflexus sp.]
MSLKNVTQRLSQVSAKIHKAPVDTIEWPESVEPSSAWFTSPKLMTIAGTSFETSLNEQTRRRLSFFEAVNFYSLNINGEKPLVEGLNKRLYAKGQARLLPYLHHFLDEENKHMQFFGRFCMSYSGKVYKDKKISFPRTYVEGEEDFLFFAKVVIFEEIADYFNILQAADENLHPVARKINLLHHQDEARHLTFGRQLVLELFEEKKTVWSTETLQGISIYLLSYMVATWKEYYNPEMYRDAGLSDSYEMMTEAWNCEAQKNLRREASSKCIRFFLDTGIITEEPDL